MERLWNMFRKKPRNSDSTEEQVSVSPTVTFDKKYKTIVKCDYSDGYTEMLYWLDENSDKSVDVKFENAYGSESIFVGFENSDDALLFRIRFSI